MKDFISQRAREIPPSGIRKFFDLALTMEEVISLGVGEPDFPTPWNLCEASIYSIEQGGHHIPPTGVSSLSGRPYHDTSTSIITFPMILMGR